MSTWIVSSLRDAAFALARNGEKELAASIGRLVDEPEVQELRLYRSEAIADLADELYDCDSLDDLHALLSRVASAFDVSHCIVFCIRERSTAFFSTKVLTTFPKGWLDEYVDRRHSAIDPNLARCRLGPGTFFWDELVVTDPITKQFVRSSIAHGIGPSGITYVQQGAYGSTIGFAMSSTAEPDIFRRSFESKLSDFHDAAALVAEVFSDLACEANQAAFSATDDQLKVLRALASGRPISEVEAFHFCYGSFKTIEKSILKSFGAKTLMQAVAIASNKGLLEDLPYFQEDIFAGGNGITAVNAA